MSRLDDVRPGDILTVDDRRYRVIAVTVREATEEDEELGAEEGDFVASLELTPVGEEQG